LLVLIVHLITTVLRVVRPGGVRPSSNLFSPNITLHPMMGASRFSSSQIGSRTALRLMSKVLMTISGRIVA
jgi:hypothetical protein